MSWNPQPGQLYLDVSNAAYHAGPGLSRSGIMRLLRAPAFYRYPDPDEKDTEAIIFGAAFHDYVLLPGLFKAKYEVLPVDYDGRKKEFKGLKEAIALKGKIAIKPDWLSDIIGMHKSLMVHPEIKRIMSAGQPEVSGYWEDVDTRVLCKLRLDWLNTSTNEILDLKSTQDARLHPFSRQAKEHGYHIQVGHYLSGITTITKALHNTFYFAAVEKKAPNYAVKLYRASEWCIQSGRTLAAAGIYLFKDCQDHDSWPAYGIDVEEIDVVYNPLRGRNTDVMFG